MRSVWLPASIVVGVLALGAYLYPLLAMDYASQREVDRLESQLENLQERNDDLRGEVDRLKTPAGIEEAARESLGYVKPGENAYVVVSSDETGEETAAVMPVAETVLDDEPPTWWESVLDFVFGETDE